jgi:hypothetical protein
MTTATRPSGSLELGRCMPVRPRRLRCRASRVPAARFFPVGSDARTAALVNRYYDPATGQFLSIDPLVDETDEAYGYTGGNPVIGTDPNGLLLAAGGFGYCDYHCQYELALSSESLPTPPDLWNELGHTADGTANDVSSRINAAVCANVAPGSPIGYYINGPADCSNRSATSQCDLAASGPLKLLHDEGTLESSSSYQYWTRQSTDTIQNSLLPGSSDGLLTNSAGVVLDGNTRLLILTRRGFDIDSLPREIYLPRLEFDGGDPGMDLGG